MRSAVGYLSSNLSTQPALMSSVRVASSGKTRARRLCSRLMAWVVCLTLDCSRPATSRKTNMGGDEAGVASGSSTTAKRAMAWLSVSSVVRLGKWAFW